MSAEKYQNFHQSPFSLIGPITDKILKGLDSAGSPVIITASPEENGMERSDTKKVEGPEDPHKMFLDIYNEGVLLAGVDAIDIDHNREVIIFNSAAASSHTLLRVPYEDFNTSFRQQANQLNFPLHDEVLIKGIQSYEKKVIPPKYVPLDMLVWIMVRDKNTGLISPTDLSDFHSPFTNNPDINNLKFQFSDEKLEEIFSTVVKRGKLASNTLLDLYENVIRQNVLKPFSNIPSDLPEKTEEDIMQGVVNGYYRGDAAKRLGQFEYDHRGKGPMSNPSVHFRYTCHIPVDVINKLTKENPSLSFEDIVGLLREDNEYFASDMKFAQMRRRPGEKRTDQEVLHDYLAEYNALDIVKMIDPYASIIHEYMNGWLREQLEQRFAEFSPTVSLFQHHTSEFEKELRVSEGAEIVIASESGSLESNQRVLAQSLSVLTKFIGETLYPLWDDVNVYVEGKVLATPEEQSSYLLKLQKKYQLPQEAVERIHELQLTERQLKNLQQRPDISEKGREKIARKLNKYQENKWVTRKMKHMLTEKMKHFKADFNDFIELVTWEQYGQLFEDEDLNQGYNIPGVPGMGITYHYDKNGHLHLQTGWLMSMKGLSELWLGAMYKKRAERNSA